MISEKNILNTVKIHIEPGNGLVYCFLITEIDEDKIHIVSYHNYPFFMPAKLRKKSINSILEDIGDINNYFYEDYFFKLKNKIDFTFLKSVGGGIFCDDNTVLAALLAAGITLDEFKKK